MILGSWINWRAGQIDSLTHKHTHTHTCKCDVSPLVQVASTKLIPETGMVMVQSYSQGVIACSENFWEPRIVARETSNKKVAIIPVDNYVIFKDVTWSSPRIECLSTR